MSNTDDATRPLGQGLPRSLSGLRALQGQLCLSTRTKPSRRDVLESHYVVDRTGDLGSGRKADRDRKRMLAFYGDPELRRELWLRHMAPASSSAGGRPPEKADLLPPSLEMQVLTRCGLVASSPADDLEPAKPGEGGACSDAAAAETIGRTVARTCRERLSEWASLKENERFDATLLVFCGATLLDDRGLIERACADVPEVTAEFAALLESGEPAPLNGKDAATGWRTACQRLSALASKAAANAADDDALRAVRMATSALERLDSRAVLEELQATVRGFLDDIANEPICATVDDEQLAELRGRWGGVTAGPPASARTELQRVRTAFRSGFAKLRKLARQHQKTERELESLRQNEPARGRSRREWEDRRLAGRQKASELQRVRREAEDALLGDLAPSRGMVNAASTAEAGDTESAAPTTTPRPDSESSRDDRPFEELEDLRKTLAAERRDLAAIRQDRDSLRGELGRAKQELSSLKNRRSHSDAGGGTIDSGFFLQLAARKQEPTPLECIDALARAFGDRCVVLDTARDSAKQMPPFRHGRKLLQLLLTLVTDYRDQLMNGGDAEARRLFGNHYAAKESSTVNGNAELRSHRIFRHEGRDIEMFQHLKIGAKADQQKTIRIHFAWDGGSKRIVIGHCGKHLPRLKEA